MALQVQSTPPLSLTWSWLVASDPGWLRLKIAARALLSVSLTLGALLLISRVMGVSIMAMALGVVVSQLATTAVQDPKTGQQKVTLLLIPIVAGAGFLLADALASRPVVADLGFLGVIFAAVYARRFGSRWMALGMAGYMAYFFGEFLHPALTQTPDQGIGLVVAAIMAFLSRFVLLPDRPSATLTSILQALRREAGLLASEVGEALRAGEWGQRGKRARKALLNLSQTVIVAEEQLDAFGETQETEDLRGRIFVLQQAADEFFHSAQAPIREALRQPLSAEIQAVADRLRTGKAAPAPTRLPPDAAAPLPKALSALEQAADAVVRAPVPEAQDNGQAKAQSSGAQSPQGTSGPLGLRPTTRQAIQVTVACGLAIFAGHLLSTQRWFWAVITAFVVFTGVQSRGDTIYKGLQRLGGTLVGVAAGVGMATLLTGHVKAEFAILLASIFLGFYSMRVSYTAMVVFITLMVAMLYGLLGYFSASLLLLRIEETAVGAVIGIAVAVLLLPAHTDDQVRKAVSDFLQAVEDTVNEGVGRLGGEAKTEPSLKAVQTVQTRLEAVRVALRPLRLEWGAPRARTAQRDLALLRACSYWTREFSLAQTSADNSPQLRISAAQVKQKLEDLKERLSRPVHRRSNPGAPARPEPPAPLADSALRALSGLSATLDTLAASLR